jgi:hemolysin D
VQAAIGQAQHSLTAWKTDTLRSLNERHAQADLQARALSAESQKTGQREKLTTLSAPVAGTVQQLAVRTTGGVVTPAQVLMVVVPHEAQVTAEVTLENKDVGFVNVGQDAEIKLETFTFTRYGTVPAKVRTITADAVMEHETASVESKGSYKVPGGAVFPAILELSTNNILVDGRRVKINPGMSITAEIKTGKRRIIEYLLSPVSSHLSESMKER